jgi:5-hydroxyisourate hydrolase-like protein (transthyretin family)
MGRILEETTKTANNDGRISHTINQGGNLASGIYFVNIDINNQRISKKVIIE